MTDNEIIKALECCLRYWTKQDSFHYCEECPSHWVENCNGKLLEITLDLVNRQKAEIEQLTKDKESLAYSFANAVGQKITAKAEAIKEFAERLKNEMYTVGFDIDNLVKEMVGDNDE